MEDLFNANDVFTPANLTLTHLPLFLTGQGMGREIGVLDTPLGKALVHTRNDNSYQLCCLDCSVAMLVVKGQERFRAFAIPCGKCAANIDLDAVERLFGPLWVSCGSARNAPRVKPESSRLGFIALYDGIVTEVKPDEGETKAQLRIIEDQMRERSEIEAFDAVV